MDINLLTSLSDNIRIDRDKCTACGKCVDICILDNLRLQLAPCRQACPIDMNCQGYIRHVAQKAFDQGLKKIWEAAPLAGILSRVCSRPCEGVCNRLKVDGQAVAIRDIKRFLSDQESVPWIPEIQEEYPLKVAIVGAGPAGLMGAFHLRSSGFSVSLYDRESAPGGLMRWAIPEFRLPGEILDRELRFIETMGIKFIGNCTLSKDIEVQNLEREFDAVLLAVGAYEETRLGIDHEDSPYIIPALQYLKKFRTQEEQVTGENIIVIGGGNSAIDVSQTALRAGAKKVTIVCLEKREEMPAFPWSIAEAEEEGVLIRNSWGPLRFSVEEGRLNGVSFKKCTTVFNQAGSFCPVYDEDETLFLPADRVILSAGQKTAMNRVYDPITFQTDNPKIFVAGDCTQGPGTIVEAMSQGKEAAISIERLFRREDLHYERRNGRPFELKFEPDWSRAIQRPRLVCRALALNKRNTFEEVTKAFTPEEAIAEAERCLNCGVPFGLRTCWFCLPCEIECPEKALYVEIPYLLR